MSTAISRCRSRLTIVTANHHHLHKMFPETGSDGLLNRMTCHGFASGLPNKAPRLLVFWQKFPLSEQSSRSTDAK